MNTPPFIATLLEGAWGSRVVSPSPEAAPELAPRVLVRAALFPIEALEAFGRGPVPQDAAEYDAAIARERRLLHAHTIGARPFARALALAHPELTRRALAWDPEGPRRKRQRHLETTLFRYLARAVGRTEPCGGFGGVGVATFGDADRIERRASTPRFTPDLAPWQAMLRALARRPSYVLRAHWALNATVIEAEPGAFVFWQRDEAGALRKRRLSTGSALAEALRALFGSPARRGHRLATRLGLSGRRGAEIFLKLTEAGLFVGGLELRAERTSAWSALEEVDLIGDDRARWREAIQATRAVARDLERHFERWTALEVLDALTRAGAVLEALHAGLRLPGPFTPPRAPLRADAGLPFRVELGPETRARLLQAIDRYQGRSCASPSEPLRAQRELELKTWLGGGRSAFEAPASRPAHAAFTLAEPRPRARRTNGDDQVAPIEPRRPYPPLGAALFRGLFGAHLDGIFDEPAALYGRFARLLGRTATPLGAWLTGAYARLARETRLEWIELIGPHDANPNVLARPPLLTTRVSLWSARPGMPSLQGARLVPHGAHGRPVIELPSEGRRHFVVTALSAADLGGHDPFSARLLQTAFREPDAASFRVAETELAPVTSTDGTLQPGLSLGGGVRLRLPRAVLAGRPLEAILAARGFERYRRWTQMAVEHGWPELLRVRRPGAAPLLVPTWSPLAVEALFEGASDLRRLTLEPAVTPQTVLELHTGRHAVELAVPFYRPAHAFTPSQPRAGARNTP